MTTPSTPSSSSLSTSSSSPACAKCRQNFRVLIGCIVFACVLTTGSALHCLQCSSIEDPLCSTGLIRPTKCDSKSIGCMTYQGKMPIPGGDVIMRDCTDRDMGTFCEEIPMDYGDFQHEICLMTCYHSKCNDEPVFP